MLKFDAEDSYEIADRGTVYTGPCPLDGKSDATNIRMMVGQPVEIGGKVYTITGVETYGKASPPAIGEPVGLLVR